MEKAVSGLKGVDSTDIDLETNMVKVGYDDAQVKPDQIKMAITEQGYDVIW